MESVVYFSGAHGSGKTTLIRELNKVRPDTFSIHKKLRLPRCDHVIERGRMRAARHYLHTFEAQELAQQEESIVFVDRCIYDDEAYVRGFTKIGWATEKDVEEIVALRRALFVDQSRLPSHIIFVDTDFEQSVANLKKRWKLTGRKKWRADNFAYLAAVQGAFREMYVESDVLHLNSYDLQSRVEKSIEWMRERRLID